MPVYEYKGLTAAGKATKGILDAENKSALQQMLEQRGIFVTDVFEGRAGASTKKEFDLGKSLQFITLRDIAVLTRQLGTLLRAGIPLVESLSALTEQADKDELKRILADVRRQVNEGSSLGDALEAHPKHFNNLYVNMVRAGESSGNLDVVLERLTEFLENQMDLRSKMTAAMAYPGIMTIFGTGILAFLFWAVLPQVTKIFVEQERVLPLPTQFLLGVNDILTTFWWLIIILMVAGIWGFRRWKSSPTGKPVWDRFLLKVPVVSSLIRMIAIARFSRTLGTLLSSGVPLLQALNIVKNILGNDRLIEVIEEVRISVREGEDIAAPLKRSGEFPPLVTHMVAIGERTGQLEEMLENIAISYNRIVDTKIETASKLLEPIMIILMGGAVAFIVFAIMLPILQMNQGY